ncbi:MAG: phosphate acyltransferase PlsX [Gammaproteobacteria bacterium]|nr:phosphate acyltransferase PlsX [Gammaproteobacteria bacterium]
MNTTIALDAMGGDNGPGEIIPAAILALKKFPRLNLILVGIEDELRRILDEQEFNDPGRIEIRHASEVVEMHEPPSQALRNKKDSSMRVAIELVKEDHAAACVSAGNTGALMATARYLLKMLPCIDRPAICSSLPAIKGMTRLLDLGANVDSSSEQLFQFAVMGTELASAIDGTNEPTVALLNIGEEEIKGNDQVKQAAALLANSHLNYIGFAEGTDIYTGNVDVIVCDGFAGNIALKASEGVAQLLRHHVELEFRKNLYGRMAALVAMPVLKGIKNSIDPRNYNGASLLGLKEIVIKSHGSADRVSFANAIKEAINEVEHDVPERISHKLEQLLTERQAI